VGGLVPSQVDEQLKRLGCPVVWMNRIPEGDVLCVPCDEVANGRMAARHLIELGHARIGYIGIDSPHYSASQRVDGIRESLSERNLDTGSLIVASRHTCMNQVVEDFLDQQDRPSAVICFHSNAFDTLVHHCCRRGIRIPEDLSVSYFASRWEVLWKDYQATRLEVPEKEMATRAVRRLLAAIEGDKEAGVGEEPITGILHPGWTTSRPGEPWAQGVARCEHDKGICVIASKR